MLLATVVELSRALPPFDKLRPVSLSNPRFLEPADIAELTVSGWKRAMCVGSLGVVSRHSLYYQINQLPRHDDDPADLLALEVRGDVLLGEGQALELLAA